MKNIQLHFDSLLNLWCFKQKAQMLGVELITARRLLIGTFPDYLVDLAVSQYNANVVVIPAR